VKLPEEQWKTTAFHEMKNYRVMSKNLGVDTWLVACVNAMKPVVAAMRP